MGGLYISSRNLHLVWVASLKWANIIMETPEYQKSFRGRANTLERTEQLRPPRRKRRDGNRRAGSVPPEVGTSGNALLSEIQSSAPNSESGPEPLPNPRVRRQSFRQKPVVNFGYSSQPSSGNNTPDIIRGPSAIDDLYDLTPFGTLESPKGNGPLRQRHKNRSSGSSHKWNWIWHRSSGSGKDSPDHTKNEEGSDKHKGSFLTRKRKNRHISCPDISSASDESSRSTSPVSFKVSLSSLFGHHGHHGGHFGTTHRSHGHGSSSSFRRPLTLPKTDKAAKTTNLTYAKPIMSHVDDFTTEIIDELCSVQYCQITDPLQGLRVESLDPQEIGLRYYCWCCGSQAKDTLFF